MVRVTNAVASHRRKKRLFKLAKGFRGDRKNHLRLTSGAVLRALAYNYIHRKQNKRNFRSLWIQRIGAAAKMQGISYSKLIHGLKLVNCELDRKALADMAVRDPNAFAAVAIRAKEALAS
jgi:large subunit ribosomal protein L20